MTPQTPMLICATVPWAALPDPERDVIRRFLTEHVKGHVKDNQSRRFQLKRVAQRRRLRDYLQGKDDGRYQTLIEKIGRRR